MIVEDEDRLSFRDENVVCQIVDELSECTGVCAFMDFVIECIIGGDALAHSAEDSESARCIFALRKRNRKLLTWIIPGLLLHHIRTERRLVKVYHRAAAHDDVDEFLCKFDALRNKQLFVSSVWIVLAPDAFPLHSISFVKLKQCTLGN